MHVGKKGKPYTIQMHFGQGNLHEIINDLASQVIHKSVGDYGSNNPRIKKMATLGHAA